MIVYGNSTAISDITGKTKPIKEFLHVPLLIRNSYLSILFELNEIPLLVHTPFSSNLLKY